MNYRLEAEQNQRLNNLSISDSQEGGINILEFKNIILRQLPVIAGCTLVAISFAFWRILTAPTIYKAQFELLSEPVNIETKVTSSDEDARRTREEITEVDLDEVQLKILKSPRLISRIVDALKDKYPELNYGDLITNLNIEIVSSSQDDQNILVVIYQDTDKQKVEDVINALTKIYQNYSVEKRQSGVKRGIAFLDRQIPQISTQTKKIEAQITNLRTQYSFNDPNASLQQITNRISQLDQKRSDNANQIKELEKTLNILDRELVTQPANLTSALGFATPRYLELLDKVQELDVEISQKSAIFSDRSEILQGLKNEKQQLNSLIAQAGTDIRRQLVDRIAMLKNRQQNMATEKNNLKTQLRQWSEISGEYRSLQHQLKIANGKLNEFVSQKDALQIDAAQKESPWQLLTPAGTPVPNQIDTVNYLILSSVLGLVLGTGCAFILDKQQNIIYNSARVEEITGLPILAVIPYSPRSKQLSFLKPIDFNRTESGSSEHTSSLRRQATASFDGATPSIESFRSFAANIGLLNFNNDLEDLSLETPISSIAITSAISGEGKSTVALNLAKATASVGKRVLIVDADLRSSRHLTNNLGLKSNKGLKDLLKQNNLSPQMDYIQQLPFDDNLFILSSGSNNSDEEFPLEDSSRLLASVKMSLLMEEFKRQFDLVIYDLCSVIGFADVNILAKKTDGIVMVTGLGKIQSSTFVEALNQLKLCNASILGVAVNKLVSNN